MGWWHYLLLVNIYLALFFGFYTLLLRRETFFQLNRLYLVAAALLSFFIPLIQSGWVKNLFITKEVQSTIYSNIISSSPAITYNFIPAKSTLTIGSLLNVLYIAVTLFFLLRLLWQLVILKKAIEKPTPSAAYSFFKKISLGSNLAQPDVISEHEQVHARQWHSVDVLLIEIIMIINWFNPVVYLYRFAIKYIHEFIADKQVIQSGTDKADYAMLLLNQTFDVPAYGFVNTFYNRTQLKQRILMLQKNRSRRIALTKYGLSAPLFILMLVLSSATINNSNVVKAIHQTAESAFSTTAEDVITNLADEGRIPEESIGKSVIKNHIESRNEPWSDINMIKPIGSRVYTSIENEPQFPGSLTDFLLENIKYPAAMREANIQGKINVQFIIETDGSLSHIKATDNLGYGSAEEAERVMTLSPKWTPALQNGKPIKAMLNVPISFILQNTIQTDDKNKIFTAVEKQPEFPGGMDKFYRFIQSNVKYPSAMRDKGIEGKAYVQFIVETDGSLSNIKTMTDPGYGSGEEAERVIALSPKWAPGNQNGRPVRVFYTVPINFVLGKSTVPVAVPTDKTKEETPADKP